MCSKCSAKSKYWIHIADNWSQAEKEEMIQYLESFFVEVLEK